ncbi:hypothetical protein D8B26_002868 [Coccidioides posadasii str. Silveira]|uniref:uncharacterized protein n=1 Tax=Coccidioides posadasii (strain RMSCC 757 / Silveira) TaxID=443226 RepID=UPI001BEE039E|nr:hypothetical protein D8B26_002868 [Coccidioides posadasii str. Silveira]
MSSPFIREEDQNPDYDPRKYYPARVGETISRRYRIISKLGWGANSTVWLAKDTTRLVRPSLYACFHNTVKLGVAVKPICDVKNYELWQRRTKICQ